MAKLPIKAPPLKPAAKAPKPTAKGRVVDPNLNFTIKKLNKLPKRT